MRNPSGPASNYNDYYAKVSSMELTSKTMVSRVQCEAMFLNSAYLSELWAAIELEKSLNFGFSIETKLIESQIQDEYRHAKMIKRLLQENGFDVNEDLRFSMQQSLHLNLSLFPEFNNSNPELIWGFHEIMERRAVWNYKTSLRLGFSEKFVPVLKKIIEDEKSHLGRHLVNWKNPTLTQWVTSEKDLFRRRIPKAYGLFDHLHNPKFWSDYYNQDLKIGL
jgi:hypothetical protein